MKACKIVAFALSAAVAVAAGCSGIKTVYTAVPTDGVQLADCDVLVRPELVADIPEAELFKKRAAEGYRLVGHADFMVTGNQDWSEAIVRKGREIKAAKIDYKVVYNALESGGAGQDAVGARSSTAPDWASSNHEIFSVTRAGGASSPYALGVDYYVYHVYYYKKIKDPKNR